MSATNELLNTVLRHAGQEVSRKEFFSIAGRGLAAGVAVGTLASCQAGGAGERLARKAGQSQLAD